MPDSCGFRAYHQHTEGRMGRDRAIPLTNWSGSGEFTAELALSGDELQEQKELTAPFQDQISPHLTAQTDPPARHVGAVERQ